MDYIKSNADLFAKEIGLLPITVDALQIVAPLDWEQHKPLFDLLEKNFKECLELGVDSYVDEHFKKGKGKYPFLGFADCSLPLILYHNTPNNSLPFLWYSWEDEVNALFPRITRHKEI